MSVCPEDTLYIAMQTLVFDLGKVLLDFDYGRAAGRLAHRSRLDAPSIRRMIDQSPLLHRYETGHMSTADFIAELRPAIGYEGSDETFAKEFGDIFTPIEPMMELHAKLNSRGFRTFIFSNTNELAIRHIRESYPFFHGFTGYILSYEHGSMKPHQRLYEVVEEKSGARGKDLVYIDDRPENVEAAAKRGWTAVLHTDVDSTKATLQHSGIL